MDGNTLLYTQQSCNKLAGVNIIVTIVNTYILLVVLLSSPPCSHLSLFHMRTEGLEVNAGNWEPEDNKGCCAADESLQLLSSMHWFCRVRIIP